MTAEEFIRLYRSEPLGFGRAGQHAFNLLVQHHPLLAEEVRGSLIDPFYRDERLPEFDKFIRENWWKNLSSLGIVP